MWSGGTGIGGLSEAFDFYRHLVHHSFFFILLKTSVSSWIFMGQIICSLVKYKHVFKEQDLWLTSSALPESSFQPHTHTHTHTHTLASPHPPFQISSWMLQMSFAMAWAHPTRFQVARASWRRSSSMSEVSAMDASVWRPRPSRRWRKGVSVGDT